MRDRLTTTGLVAQDDVELTVGAIGAFEITVDGKTKFSKFSTHRFPDDAEIDALVSSAS